jgi:hypothetical protein
METPKKLERKLTFEPTTPMKQIQIQIEKLTEMDSNSEVKSFQDFLKEPNNERKEKAFWMNEIPHILESTALHLELKNISFAEYMENTDQTLKDFILPTLEEYETHFAKQMQEGQLELVEGRINMKDERNMEILHTLDEEQFFLLRKYKAFLKKQSDWNTEKVKKKEELQKLNLISSKEREDMNQKMLKIKKEEVPQFQAGMRIPFYFDKMSRFFEQYLIPEGQWLRFFKMSFTESQWSTMERDILTKWSEEEFKHHQNDEWKNISKLLKQAIVPVNYYNDIEKLLLEVPTKEMTLKTFFYQRLMYFEELEGNKPILQEDMMNSISRMLPETLEVIWRQHRVSQIDVRDSLKEMKEYFLKYDAEQYSNKKWSFRDDSNFINNINGTRNERGGSRNGFRGRGFGIRNDGRGNSIGNQRGQRGTFQQRGQRGGHNFRGGRGGLETRNGNNEIICYRCGNRGHPKNKCENIRHINGDYLGINELLPTERRNNIVQNVNAIIEVTENKKRKWMEEYERNQRQRTENQPSQLIQQPQNNQQTTGVQRTDLQNSSFRGGFGSRGSYTRGVNAYRGRGSFRGRGSYGTQNTLRNDEQRINVFLMDTPTEQDDENFY